MKRKCLEKFCVFTSCIMYIYRYIYINDTSISDLLINIKFPTTKKMFKGILCIYITLELIDTRISDLL